MTINEIEKLTGLTKKSIRYYEQEGLVHPKREENDYRSYSEADLEVLKRIKLYRYLGFSIAEINDILNGDLDIKELLQKKADDLENQSEGLKEKQSLCIDLLKKDIGDISTINQYVEQIDFLESDEIREMKKTLVESAVPNVYAAIAQSLICCGPIGGLIIAVAGKRYEALALLIPMAYFSLRWLEAIWRYYLSYRKKHQQKVNQTNKANSLVLPMALLMVFVLIGGVIVLELTYSKYLVPEDFLFYERSQLSVVGMIGLIMVAFIVIFVSASHKMNIHRSGDYDVLIGWVLKRSAKVKAMIIAIWIVLVYICISQANIVTKDKIIIRNFLHPIGISYSYSDVEAIEAGFGQKSFSIAEYQKKGQFHYIIYVNGQKLVFMTPTVNESIDRYDDSYLELEEFDQKLVELAVEKTASKECSNYCYLDQRYVDRFLRIINNK